jgi:catechol 2,3-dioxygenase-like lactoylglutathione lyase family enzyme
MRLGGINHVATLTSDMDRLQHFYEDIFDADLLGDMREPGVRHASIALGPDTFLHPSEIEGNEQAEQALPMFELGRLDHLALNTAARADFEEGRRRLIAVGASDGTITDYGTVLSVSFRDPDGMECELCWNKHEARSAL